MISAPFHETTGSTRIIHHCNPLALALVQTCSRHSALTYSMGAVSMKLLAIGIVSGCATAALAIFPNAVPTLMAQLPTPSLPTVPQNSQRFKINLTLSTQSDLKVREGDRIKADQVLADRVRDRQRLETQKQQLQLQIDRLKQPVAGPPPTKPIPGVASLPAPSFLEEVAEVERQKLRIEQAERNQQQQQRKLDLLQAMPSHELPEATLPHETEVLAQRQREVAQANAELQVTESQLVKAQTDRQYQEYLYSLEMSKRAIAIQESEIQRQGQLQRQQEQERERAFQLAQLTAQMQTLDSQIVQLSAVRSPFSGKVRRIQFQQQNDQALLVELTLLADGDNASPPEQSGSR
jgi:hypothetical protein